MKKLLRLFFPLSLRVRFLLATAAVVLVLSLAYGMVALIGYSVSFDKTTFRLLRGESNLFYTLAKWENNKLHVELPENIDKQSPTMTLIYDENGQLLWAQRELGGNYYSDPDVPPRAHPADVLPQEMDKLREMMLELINQPEHFKQWFGEFISQSRHELDIAPPEPPYQPDEIYDALKQGDVLVRLGGLRVLRIGDDVYANGEKIDSPHRPALDALASNIALTAENFGDALEDPSFLAMLAALVNSGYWFFEG